MNRYPLNSRVIGAGSESPLSYVAAFQNFYLYVAATAHAIRGMRANQPLSLNQTSRAITTRLFSAVGTLALELSLTTRTRFQTYVTGATTLTLTTAITVHQRIKRYAQAAQTFALTSTFTIHQLIKTYAAALQNFALGQTSKYSRLVFPKVSQKLSAVGSFKTSITRSAKAAVSFVLRRAVTIRTAIGASITEALVLASSIIASDRTTLPANLERTVEIPESSRMVVVPGESYESGV